MQQMNVSNLKTSIFHEIYHNMFKTSFIFCSRRSGQNNINLKVYALRIKFYFTHKLHYHSCYKNSLFYPDCIGLQLLKIKLFGKMLSKTEQNKQISSQPYINCIAIFHNWRPIHSTKIHDFFTTFEGSYLFKRKI